MNLCVCVCVWVCKSVYGTKLAFSVTQRPKRTNLIMHFPVLVIYTLNRLWEGTTNIWPIKRIIFFSACKSLVVCSYSFSKISFSFIFPYTYYIFFGRCRFGFLVGRSVNAWVYFEKSLISEFFFSLYIVPSVQCIGRLFRILVFGMMKALKQHSIAPGWPEIYCFVVNTSFFDISVSDEWKKKNKNILWKVEKRIMKIANEGFIWKKI